MNFGLIFLILLKVFHLVKGDIIEKNLGGNSWTAFGRNSSSSHVFHIQNAVVPGCVHSDFLRNETSREKAYYYRFNDVEYRWIANSDWQYQTSFQVPTSMLEQKEQWLTFSGLDTFASISLNEVEIGQTENMFRTYRFNVTGFLQPNFNLLKVSFTSATLKANILASQLPYVIPPQSPPEIQHGFSHVNLLRKEQSSFSWDWGPAFATQGIWRPVYLKAFSQAVLEAASASFNWTDQSLTVNLKVRKTSAVNESEVNGDVIISIEELNLTKYVSDVKLRPNNSTSFIVDIQIPMHEIEYELWWPNGFGEAKLYDISVVFNTTDEISEKKFRFGFRRVQLIQEKIPSSKDGRSFYFQINGKKLFAKGANWIPADAFHDKVDRVRIENLLESARLANMNMLRVWGGGVYEDDIFYQIADEKGIMLWHDLMFACAMYPSTTAFLDNVKQEVEDNIWRLKHHPSIVLWAANNENEAALAKNWYNTSSQYQLYADNYRKLYIDTIKPLVKDLDPHKPFLTSSPTNGVESENDEDGVSNNPYDVNYGDVHYYNYNEDCLDWSKYPRTRFASEYGYQSWPSLHSLGEVSEPDEDWDVHSEWAEHRQHHTNGSIQIRNQIDRHFWIPKSENTTLEFTRLVWLSQIMQGLCYQSQTEFYLQMRGNEDENGHGGTMGALYWQLNDIWQAPTWSSIEYSGRWKPLHYFATRFFQPLTLITHHEKESGQLRVYLQSSHDDVINDEVIVSVHIWSSLQRWTVDTVPVTIKPNSAGLVYEENVNDLIRQKSDCSYDKRHCFVSLRLKNKQAEVKHVVPVEYKRIPNLREPDIKISKVTQSVDGKSFALELTAEYPALFVWLETTEFEGRFSDNAFTMTSSSKNITFHAWSDDDVITPESLLSSISIVSLRNHTGPQQLTWLDDITAKLVFAIVGVIFVCVAAVLVTCVVLRGRPGGNNAGGKLTPTILPADNHGEVMEPMRSRTSTFSHVSWNSNDSPERQLEEEKAAAFLIRSKHGYGHNAKQTEFRFYIV